MKKLYISADFKGDDMLRFRLVEMTEEEYNNLPESKDGKYRTIVIPATVGITFEPSIDSFE